jgi:hypothetical protein
MTVNISGREQWIHENIVGIAEEQFPDDIGLKWSVLSIEHRGDASAVMVEPDGNVGYSRFVFLLLFNPGITPEHIATYAWQNGKFTLLSYSAGTSGDLCPDSWDGFID